MYFDYCKAKFDIIYKKEILEIIEIVNEKFV